MVTIRTPFGSEGSISFRRSFTRWITSRAFSPWRMTTMPPTVSPLPSRSETPRRISGPRPTVATSRMRTGVPFPSVLRTIVSRSAFARR